jgi:hypothetical protein
MSLLILPSEIIARIALMLPGQERMSLSRVCKAVQHIFHEYRESLWQEWGSEYHCIKQCVNKVEVGENSFQVCVIKDLHKDLEPLIAIFIDRIGKVNTKMSLKAQFFTEGSTKNWLGIITGKWMIDCTIKKTVPGAPWVTIQMQGKCDAPQQMRSLSGRVYFDMTEDNFVVKTVSIGDLWLFDLAHKLQRILEEV